LINDSLGHNAGDELLIAAARRIERVLAENAKNMSYLLARIGGDEFTILLENISEDGEAFQLAEAIRRRMNEPYRLRESSIYSPASLGLALGKESSAEDLMRNADIALYRAKLHGRGRTEIFEQAMHTAAVDQLNLESNLRNALASGEFSVHYQPIFNLEAGKLQGFEALIRWHHEGRLMPPEEFIPLCEETGVIVFIGEWVLDRICDDLKIMEAAKTNAEMPLTMSINISPRQFMQDNFADYVLMKLREENIPPSKICLEVTEAVMVKDFVRAQIVFGALRSHGIKIGIDDFGKGYSSLNYLRQLPADILKIDGSFISAMAADKNSYEVVDLILQLAKRLSLKTIAEGIEDETADRLLREMGCNCGQGYFYGKPGPLSQALEHLSAGRE
jgi:diguanylate cyclase (GGDEF)-like protein